MTRLLMLKVLLLFQGCAVATSKDRIAETMADPRVAQATAEQHDANWLELEKSVRDARYVDRGDGPWEGRISAPTARISEILTQFRMAARTNHLPLLLEYGLKHHPMNLEFTGIGRELDVEHNSMLAELVRLLAIPRYKTAHEAGWLNSQFHGEFSGTGWSSYQIYVAANERGHGWWGYLPNADRLESLMTKIRLSGKANVGGYGVCHYGCK